MAKLRPLGDKILVKRVEAESKTKSGIVLPDTAKEKPQKGKVIAVGSGARGKDGKVTPWEFRAQRRGVRSSRRCFARTCCSAARRPATLRGEPRPG